MEYENGWLPTSSLLRPAPAPDDEAGCSRPARPDETGGATIPPRATPDGRKTSNQPPPLLLLAAASLSTAGTCGGNTVESESWSPSASYHSSPRSNLCVQK